LQNNRIEKIPPLSYAIIGDAFQASEYLLQMKADPN